jgi:hypothetical protein
MGETPRPPPRASSGAARTLALVVAAAVAITAVRAPLTAVNRRVRETSEVYTLPPPKQLVSLSLGYRSALADVLWAYVLVAQGIHTEERRRFSNVIQLLHAVNELEPTFRAPYLYADGLITFQVNETPHHEVVATREILERGMRERPLDGSLWLAAGEFVAFVAPGSYLTDPAEQEAWKLDGARMLAHAAEIGGDDASIGFQAFGAAKLLGRAGDRDAEIRFLRRTLTVTDDPELKDKAESQLRKLLGEERDDVLLRLEAGIRDARRGDLPHVARVEYMVIGPPRDPYFCAGPAHAGDLACSPTWRAWEERSEKARKEALDR